MAQTTQRCPLILSLSVLACLAISPSKADTGQPKARILEPKQTLVAVMSWNTPLGSLNGTTMWRKDGYQYLCNQSGKQHGDYPLLPNLVLPEKLKVGSAAYLDLQKKAAALEMQTMKEAGFDVALFDMPPWPRYDPAQALSPTNVPTVEFQTFLGWLDAAEAIDFKVGVFPDVMNRSGDYPQGYKLNAEEWVRNLAGAYHLIANKKSLWRVNGRPAAVHFGTSVKAGDSPPIAGAPEPDGGWGTVLSRLRAMNKDFFFYADIRPTDRNRSNWNSIANGVWSFAPAGPKTYLADIQPVLQRTFTVPMIHVVSPGYYNTKQNAYTEPDFERIHRAYAAALASGTRQLAVMTWNDFYEDTGICPSAHKGRALLDVFAFYNRYFKEGAYPSNFPETVVVAYPIAIPAVVHTRSPNWGKSAENQAKYKPSAADLVANPQWGNWVAPPYSPKVFWWAWLKSPRVLNVPRVGTTNLSAGLSFGTLGVTKIGPFQIRLGGTNRNFPPVLAADDEKDCGLYFRYVEPLSEPLRVE